jgi:DNA-directed RNA polymerase specialized sigma24 family protein
VDPISCIATTAGRLTAVRDLDDQTLLDRFARAGDADAFEVLVRRHGGLVRGVCRRYLRNPADVDDVTQVAFLALARRAGSVRAVGPWLASVAARAARRLRRANAVRAVRFGAPPTDVPGPGCPPDAGWRGVVIEEVARLPAAYRAVVRRCYLDGLSTAEASRELGWARGTVLTRLAWARRRLRHRLTARGVTLGAGGVAAILFELAAGPVTRAAVRDILRALAGSPGPRVARLTDGVLTAMFWSKVRCALGIVLACGTTLIGVRMAGSADGPQPGAPRQADPSKKADPPKKSDAPKPGDPAAPAKKPEAAAKPTDAAKAQEMLKKAAAALANNPQDPEALKLIRDAQDLLLKGVAGGPTSPGAPVLLGDGGESMSVRVGNGTFAITARKSGVAFEIEGTAAADGGKPVPTRIRIDDGAKKVDAKSLREVPAEFRDRVEELLAGVNGGP